MKRIILYIASSLDGYITESDGSIDFLSDYPINEQMNYGYNDFISSVDTIIMGGKSYRELMSMDVVWPYKEQTTYVISHNDWGEKENIKFITDNVVETIEALRQQVGKNIWLFSGGKTISILLEADLVDEMRIFYVPTMLGKGTPLFPAHPQQSKWKLTGSKTYNNNILEVNYIKE
ncbi:dihydrofolate reductase family protein [Parabacteroides sp. OttesenSCG-928-K15]|nr:dihydrofolate reductase family protein [Parabacteroides sp. OttesenSCG-928-K15]